MSYPKPDENAETEWTVKSYTGATLVAEVCKERGLAFTLHRPDLKDPFVCFCIIATKKDFHAARFEWVSRMTTKVSISQPAADLFA